MNTVFQSPGSSRRWLRFSLRTFIILITCACVWLAVISQRARNQRRSIQELLKFNAPTQFVDATGNTIPLPFPVTIQYDYQIPDDLNFDEDAEPPGPRWLRDQLGLDYFASVTSVNVIYPSSEV